MYLSFYKLTASPFRLAPDYRFFYASPGHKKGLAYLKYGVEQGQGVVVVTGLPGTGKSTLVQTLFAEVSGRPLVLANLSSVSLEAEDVLISLAYHFDVYEEGLSRTALLLALEEFLKQQVSAGKQVLVTVDEAQSLSTRALEELCILSNLHQGDRPLLQVMLLGQLQLKETIAAPEFEQLRQRIIASCHLAPLDLQETRAYVAHRLHCAGWQGDPEFSAEALAYIFAVSGGVPRLINLFCDRLLLTACLDERYSIDQDVVETLIGELKHESTGLFVNQRPDPHMQVALEPLNARHVDRNILSEWNPVRDEYPPLRPARQQSQESVTDDSTITEATSQADTPAATATTERPNASLDVGLENDEIPFQAVATDASGGIFISRKLMWLMVCGAALMMGILAYK